MKGYVERHSEAGRRAAQSRDWRTVQDCARQILKVQKSSAEGHFLSGLAEKAANRPERARRAFVRALHHDQRRYDAAIELASQYVRLQEHGEAVALLDRFAPHLNASPKYLEMAATLYSNVGLPGRAWPLYVRANELQPGIPSLQAKLAACSVFVGRLDDARKGYEQLLRRAPGHQRNHYELSRIVVARNDSHLRTMQSLLASASLAPEKNIYLYYAIGKELEDLKRWDEAFDYFRRAGAAAKLVSDYNVGEDVALIDRVIDVCDADWIGDNNARDADTPNGPVPVFVVGLPRSGTTLTERVLSSHSRIESIGETFALQTTLQRLGGNRNGGTGRLSPAHIHRASQCSPADIRKTYLQAVSYRLTGADYFIEKFPENFLYLGFIAKAFPEARIVLVQRNPLDACFAMFKQSFFRYAYSLDDLGQYYQAYDRLVRHWRRELPDRLIEVNYEQLVTDQDRQTRTLLNAVGVCFEAGCLSFELNTSATNTASAVQVREKMHRRSVDRWRQYEMQLEPLRRYLDSSGIDVEQEAATDHG